MLLWMARLSGGTEQTCGWLKDRSGVSWQIPPSGIQEIMEFPDIQKFQRVLLALYQMKKIDLLQIMQAAESR